MMLWLLSSVFLGWSLGANDSSNAFGTAVSSRMVKYSTAIWLTAVFVMIGALLQGQQGLKTLSALTCQTQHTAFITLLAAAVTITIMTLLKFPISTSQAVVGAILGIGVMQNQMNMSALTKVVICWIGTPIGGFLFCILLYHLFLAFFRSMHLNIFTFDTVLRGGLLLAGCYGAYALGANNVANVTGVFSNNLLSPFWATFIGGASIGLGAVTFSKDVMLTVGKSIVKLDAFSAFIAVVAHAVTVHIYAMIGVPVSTSQAIVGAVLAIGFIKGLQTINFKVFIEILIAWIFTPFIGMGLAMLFYIIL